MTPARITASAVTTTLVAALFACTSERPAPAATGPSPSAGATTRVVASEHDLFLGFNGKSGSTPDLASSGSAAVTTRIASAEDGAVVAVNRRGAGRAARFEPFDDDPPAPLAVLVIEPEGDSDPFAPGTAPFSFGADLKLDDTSEGTDVDDGNNLFQRGLYDDDAQFKMQVDSERVSCRVSGSAGSVVVAADFDLRTGRWYRARCTRKDRTVVLRLVRRTSDGVVRHRWSRTGDIGKLAFSGAPPISVGGKITATGEVVESSSDQFNGRVDNVFFRRLGG